MGRASWWAWWGSGSTRSMCLCLLAYHASVRALLRRWKRPARGPLRLPMSCRLLTCFCLPAGTALRSASASCAPLCLTSSHLPAGTAGTALRRVSATTMYQYIPACTDVLPSHYILPLYCRCCSEECEHIHRLIGGAVQGQQIEIPGHPSHTWQVRCGVGCRWGWQRFGGACCEAGSALMRLAVVLEAGHWRQATLNPKP